MVDCVVCRYWSERLEDTRKCGQSKRTVKQARRLMVVLRSHQSGACGHRFPELLLDLVKQDQELPDEAPGQAIPRALDS